jgi:hypothetical protein
MIECRERKETGREREGMWAMRGGPRAKGSGGPFERGDREGGDHEGWEGGEGGRGRGGGECIIS